MERLMYSLADYILTVTPNDAALRRFGNITVGGEGNAMNSVSISFTNDIWTTETYATGAYVHNLNLNRSGTATVTLSQLAEQVGRFIQFCKYVWSGKRAGLTLTLTDRTGKQIWQATDCHITKIPSQDNGESAATQSWNFVCGQINIA